MEWREGGLERGRSGNGLDLITRTGIIISQTGGHVPFGVCMYVWVEWSGVGRVTLCTVDSRYYCRWKDTSSRRCIALG